MKQILLILLIILNGVWSSVAQMNVTNTTPFNSSIHLLQNVFMGSNITAFNFEYNGTANGNVNNQVGYFTGGGNIIGIDSGLVMSSGNINSIPNNGFASTSFNGSGDADVLQVAQSIGWGTPPNVMRDRAVLEFDFVAPQGDSISFEYCFGSEEWPTYPCSQYNDAFGFFISGPGINGAYSNNAENVSIIPGTDTLPVSITSIHNGTGANPCNGNPSYNQYYNNGPINNAFTFADLNNGNYAGAWTDVFETKRIWVNACDTYHVKMAICDGVDRIFDSAVFLKAKSFEFFGISVNPQPSYNPWGFDSALYEGCGNLELYFTRIDSTYPPYTLEYSIAGNATMGVDYETIPGCSLVNGIYECEITFQQDSSSVGVNVEIYYDTISESYETFDFIVTDSNVSMCGSNDTLSLTIIDQPLLSVSSFGNTTLDCNDSAALIGVTINNGLPPYTYTWSNITSGDSTQYVQPSVTTAYSMQVEDGCGFQTATEVITVGVFNVPWSVVKIGDEQTINCTDSPVDIAVGIEFNDQIWHGDISYLWGDGTTDSTLSVFSLVDTSYNVIIERNCTGEQIIKTFNLYVDNNQPILTTENIDEDEIDCPGEIVDISVQVSNGYPPYTYLWENGSTDSTNVVNPIITHIFYVTVMDICQLKEHVDSVIVSVPTSTPLTIRGVINDTVMCKNMKVHFGPAVAEGGFGWGYELSWDNFQTKSGYWQDIIYGKDSFNIRLTDGCKSDTASLTVYGIIAKKSNLTLNLNDTVICNGDVLELSPKVSGGGGNYKYHWSNGSTDSTLITTPKSSTEYELRLTDFCDSIRIKKVNVKVPYINPLFEYVYESDYEAQFDASPSTSMDSIILYEWFVDSGFMAFGKMPIISFNDMEMHEIILQITDTNECLNTYTNNIQQDFYLNVPNTFSPNDDGINDYWEIKSLGIGEINVKVLNRWGNLMFETTDKEFQWDGNYLGYKIPISVYTFSIRGYTNTKEYFEKQGTLSILNVRK